MIETSNLWEELAPGIVVASNVGEGKRYIKKIERLVSEKQLSWKEHTQKVIKEDINRKSMSTMYINNVRRWKKDFSDPTPEDILHEELFSKFEKDFKFVVDEYVTKYKVPCTQKEDYEILKYGAGNFFIDHVDDGLFMTRKVSMVYYFNDDYEGGEMYFPRFDLTIKPKEGQLLLFPAAYIYNHNVSEIISGTRYSMVNWLK
jgi:Rps23 Pro-64 3,4-dihydroxylase Tpa1-like proline 4-hydroxylase